MVSQPIIRILKGMGLFIIIPMNYFGIVKALFMWDIFP